MKAPRALGYLARLRGGLRPARPRRRGRRACVPTSTSPQAEPGSRRRRLPRSVRIGPATSLALRRYDQRMRRIGAKQTVSAAGRAAGLPGGQRQAGLRREGQANSITLRGSGGPQMMSLLDPGGRVPDYAVDLLTHFMSPFPGADWKVAGAKANTAPRGSPKPEPSAGAQVAGVAGRRRRREGGGGEERKGERGEGGGGGGEGGEGGGGEGGGEEGEGGGGEGKGGEGGRGGGGEGGEGRGRAGGRREAARGKGEAVWRVEGQRGGGLWLSSGAGEVRTALATWWVLAGRRWPAGRRSRGRSGSAAGRRFPAVPPQIGHVAGQAVPSRVASRADRPSSWS